LWRGRQPNGNDNLTKQADGASSASGGAGLLYGFAVN
jgi:hypothetical protein